MNIIAWGAGGFFRDLATRTPFRVHRVVDIDPAKWGSRVAGRTVENPADVFPGLDPGTTLVLVCATRGVPRIRECLAAFGPFLAVDMADLMDPGGGPDALDLVAAARTQATAESASYMTEHMLVAPRFPSAHAMLASMLAGSPKEGLVLEFGVAAGTTLRILAAGTPRKVWGFDSFEGLPESWNLDCPAGTFACEPPRDLPANAHLVVGLFDASLPAFLETHPEPIAFLHIDVDLYQSCRTVLEAAGPRLRPGTVIVFDEYFNYPGWRQHEFRAFREFVERTGIRYEYQGFVVNGEAVAVRICDV